MADVLIDLRRVPQRGMCVLYAPGEEWRHIVGAPDRHVVVDKSTNSLVIFEFDDEPCAFDDLLSVATWLREQFDRAP